ncbi:MAG: anti-sigma factor [Chloroflexota bacterium]
MDHAAMQQLAAGAALDDLDDAEHQELDRHLASCGPCRDLRADLDDVVGDLALAAPELRPPAGLRGEVLAALRAPVKPDLALVGPVTPVRLATPVGMPRRAGTWGAIGLAAVLGIVAVGLGARTVQLTDEAAGARVAVVEAQRRIAAQEAAMALVADPAHRIASLHAEPVAPVASAIAIFRPGTTEAYLMANDLPATPVGFVYQLWFADATGVHALGTFHHDGEGPFIAPFGVDLGSSAAAMVTLEPEGGAQGEPGPQVVFGEF